MAKDPAFLFYSKDFYEGTRTMMPDERACYIDLLIYQHQHGKIPLDLKRMAMYCSGCGVDIIKSVLNQKFEQMDDGWLSNRLTDEQKKRASNKPKRIASATLAGLISANNFSPEQIEIIKSEFNISNFIYDEKNNLIDNEEVIKLNVRDWLTNLVNHTVDNIANANANAINSSLSNFEKGGTGVKTFDLSDDEPKPASRKRQTGSRPEAHEAHVYFIELGRPDQANKFLDYYESNGWKVGRNPMKDWKAAARRWISQSTEFQRSDQNKPDRMIELGQTFSKIVNSDLKINHEESKYLG